MTEPLADWLPLMPWVFAVACFVTLLAGLIQGTVGFGFATLSVPILSLVDERLAPVPQLILALPLASFMLLRERKGVDFRGVALILVGRIPGAALGLILLKLASDSTLNFLIGAIVLVAVVVIASGKHVPRNAFTKFGAGVVSGIFSLVSSIGGPPIALLYKDEKGPTIRASLAAVFLMGLFITIAARVLSNEMSLEDLTIGLSLVPALLLGVVLSNKLTIHAEGPALKRAILSLAGVAGVAVIVKAVFS